MRNSIYSKCLLVLLIIGSVIPGFSFSQTLESNVLASAGASQTSEFFQVSSTVGELAVNFNGNTSPVLSEGFQQAVNCEITDIFPVDQTHCDIVDNRYDEILAIHYINPPTTGNLDVNGVISSITSSPQNVLLQNLPSDAFDVDVNAYFTAATECSLFRENVFTAPNACNCISGTIPSPIDLASTEFEETFKLSWSAISGSIACQIRGNRTDAPPNVYANIIEFGDEPSERFINKGALIPNKTYWWKVRCGCSTNPVVAGPWSDTAYFNYFILLESPDLNSEEVFEKAKSGEPSNELIVFPNPTANNVFLDPVNFENGIYTIALFDEIGKKIFSRHLQINTDKELYEIDLTDISPGIYMLSVQSGNRRYLSRISIVE